MFFSKITFTGDGATFETAVVGNKTEAEVTFFGKQICENLVKSIRILTFKFQTNKYLAKNINFSD
jgi:hypothetical protein